MHTKHTQQSKLLVAAMSDCTINGTSVNTGIERSRLHRLISGEAPMLFWEALALSNYTGINLLNSPTHAAILEDALDAKYPNRKERAQLMSKVFGNQLPTPMKDLPTLQSPFDET